MGRILGKALLDRHLVRFRLSQHIFKLLLGWPISFDDLQDVDCDCYSVLVSLDEEGASSINNSGRHFTSSEDLLGMKTRVPLVANGFDLKVNDVNFPQYVDAMLQYRVFDRCKDQLTELVLGFCEVIPESLLLVFYYQELETLLCGSYISGKRYEQKMKESQSQMPTGGVLEKLGEVPPNNADYQSPMQWQ